MIETPNTPVRLSVGNTFIFNGVRHRVTRIVKEPGSLKGFCYHEHRQFMDFVTYERLVREGKLRVETSQPQETVLPKKSEDGPFLATAPKSEPEKQDFSKNVFIPRHVYMLGGSATLLKTGEVVDLRNLTLHGIGYPSEVVGFTIEKHTAYGLAADTKSVLALDRLKFGSLKFGLDYFKRAYNALSADERLSLLNLTLMQVDDHSVDPKNWSIRVVARYRQY